MAVVFKTTYGDVDAPFYTVAENSFDKVCSLIAKNKMADTYRDRCGNMVWQIRGSGWGFFDTLNSIMHQHFENKT
jgi:hypothetical protein